MSSASPSAYTSPPASQAAPGASILSTSAAGTTAVDGCPPAYGYGDDLRDGTFGPGSVIKGPAAIQALRGSFELGQTLGLPDVPRWGIDVPAGHSVTIPPWITLLGGQGTWAPTGFYEIYATDADVGRA